MWDAATGKTERVLGGEQRWRRLSGQTMLPPGEARRLILLEVRGTLRGHPYGMTLAGAPCYALSHRIAQQADAVDLDLYQVAPLQGRGRARRSREQQIAGLQRHHLAGEAH